MEIELFEAKKRILSGECVLENHCYNWDKLDIDTILNTIAPDGRLIKYRISTFFGLNKYGEVSRLFYDELNGRERIYAINIKTD